MQTIHSFLHIKSTFQNYSCTIIENSYFKTYARILTTFRMICLGYYINIKVEHHKYILLALSYRKYYVLSLRYLINDVAKLRIVWKFISWGKHEFILLIELYRKILLWVIERLQYREMVSDKKKEIKYIMHQFQINIYLARKNVGKPKNHLLQY